jgi:hypothetical protein
MALKTQGVYDLVAEVSVRRQASGAPNAYCLAPDASSRATPGFML